MTDKKTIKVSALTGAGVFSIMFLLMLFNQAGDNEIGYCNSTGKICVAVDGFSGGQGTRCYNETDMNWWEAPYCEEGWAIVSNDLKVNKTQEINQSSNQSISAVWGKQFRCNATQCVEI